MFKEDNNRHNKRDITKSRKCLRLKANKIQYTPFGEDNDLIGTFENEEEESLLYISYSRLDSHERNDHSDTNNS